MRGWLCSRLPEGSGPSLKPGRVSRGYGDFTATSRALPSIAMVATRAVGSLTVYRMKGFEMVGRVCGTLVAAAVLASAFAGCALQPRADATDNDVFSFALIGDMPYGAAEVPRFDRLIDAINADDAVSLVVHVGDIKGGGERCDDALLRERHAQLQRIEAPWIYAIGDNEWTDCHRASAGGFLPLERLAFLRTLFFADPGRSGGRLPLATESQSAQGPAHPAYVEHALFMHRGVLFATLHVVGSRNDLEPWSGIDPNDSPASPRADRLAEFDARQAAALAWIDHAFDEAIRRDAAGVVIVWQANPGIERPVGDPHRTGFEALLERLKARTVAFGKPVLLAHGDHHELLIDQPWNRDAEPAPKAPRFTRIQGYGSPRIAWVRVVVDPSTAGLFRFEPKWTEEGR